MQIKQRPRHPHKEIEASLQYAEKQDFRILKRSGKGHAWGSVLCILASSDGCRKSVWSTPRDPYRHALDIRKFVDRCQHTDDDAEGLKNV